MQYEVIFAGFGGQGVMLIGQLLANAAMYDGKEACWMPSYGPEMRGGTANCTVIISDDPIGSPIVPDPDAAVVMNRPSMDKFEPTVKPGGLLVVNSSLIDRKAFRTDIRVVYIDANRLAEENAGSNRMSNMVILGAYLGLTGATSVGRLKATMEKKMASKARFIPANVKCLEVGIAEAAAQG